MCILAIISRAPTYGYEIVTELAEEPQLAAAEGTVYPLLRRLKKDGLVETTWQESAAGPPRQYYRITSRGIETLAAMRAAWADLVEAIGRYGREDRAAEQGGPA